MSEITKPISASADDEAHLTHETGQGDWPLMPTETEIYILPDGRVIFADLPIELSDLATTMGEAEPCAVVSVPAEIV